MYFLLGNRLVSYLNRKLGEESHDLHDTPEIYKANTSCLLEYNIQCLGRLIAINGL